MKKIIVLLFTVLSSFMVFSFQSKAFEVPTNNLGVTFENITEIEYYFSDDLTIYDVYFHDALEDTDLDFDVMYSFMSNVDGRTRIYLLENDYQYYFTDNTYPRITGIKTVVFYYNPLGASSSYVLLIDAQGTILLQRYMNTFSSNTSIRREVSMITEYDIGYNAGVHSTLAKNIWEQNGYKQGQEDYYNGVSNYDYFDLYPMSESVAFQQGFDLGYANEFGFDSLIEYIFKPFELFEKEIAFDITIGHVAMISIVIGLMGFLFSIKGKRWWVILEEWPGI